MAKLITSLTEFDNTVLDAIDQHADLIDENIGQFLCEVGRDSFSEMTPKQFITLLAVVQDVLDIDDPQKTITEITNIVVRDEGYFKWDRFDYTQEYYRGLEDDIDEVVLSKLNDSISYQFSSGVLYSNVNLDFQTSGNYGSIPLVHLWKTHKKPLLSQITDRGTEYYFGIVDSGMGYYTHEIIGSYAKTMPDAHYAFTYVDISKNKMFKCPTSKLNACWQSLILPKMDRIVYASTNHVSKNGQENLSLYSWYPKEIVDKYSMPVIKY